MELDALLSLAERFGASDLHLSAGVVPTLRVEGELKPLPFSVLLHTDVLNLIFPLLTPTQRNAYEAGLDVDFAFDGFSFARCRVHFFHQARGAAAAVRFLPSKIPHFGQLGLPSTLKDIAALPQGLVLVAGPTGSGKSTTLAAMIEYINQHKAQHILTIEDPIEFVYTNSRSLIHQREIQRDVLQWSHALRSALREDPDVILIGELRDLETIRLALTAAETGHLVFSTLHTQAAPDAISRLIDVFPGDEKGAVRTLLSEVLQAVVAQRLLKNRDGKRIAVCEVMRCNPAIRHMIREGKNVQLYSAMQTGQAYGMSTFGQELERLMVSGIITEETIRSMGMDQRG